MRLIATYPGRRVTGSGSVVSPTIYITLIHIHMPHIPVKQGVLTFRHFSRKGWSLFACLHREVRIGVLSVATLLAATPRLMGATVQQATSPHSNDDVTADTLSIATATVTASRAPLTAGLQARQVTTLTLRDLQAAGVKTINDALKLSANVDVRQRSGFGIQTDISIDGGTHDQLTILIDGVPIVNPQTGHNAADFPLNLSDIERIEVLQGAASRVAGSQAFSGAIHIITRRTESSQPLEASLEGGSYGTLRAEARTAYRLGGGWSVSASGSYQRSDGTTERSAFEGGKALAHLTQRTASYVFDAKAGLTMSRFDANTFYSAAYPQQWEATQRFFVSAQMSTRGRVHFEPKVAWLRNIDHYQLIRHSHTGENYHRSDVYTASLGAWTDWAAGRTAVGAELREEDLLSTNLGRPLEEGRYVQVAGAPGKFYTKSDSRTNAAYYLEHNVTLRRFTLSAGVMAQHNSSVGNGFRFYPGLDVSYRPSSAVKVYASVSRALRLPSFTEWYYKSPTQEGNVNLRPEECTDLRLGADYRQGGVSLSGNLLYRRGTDMIDWVMRTADDIYHATSFALDTWGASLDARFDLKQTLGSRQPLRRLTAGYAWLTQHRRKGEAYFKSNYAQEYLRHKFVVTLAHDLVSKLSAEWTLRGCDREGAFLVYSGGAATAELRPYGFHALLDCKVQWTAAHYKLYVDMTNLTSHRYYDLANVLQPGFVVMAGVAWKL